jgi:hypothetical protein
MNAQVKVSQDDKNRRSKEEEAGARMGIDLAKTRQQIQAQQEQVRKPAPKGKE